SETIEVALPPPGGGGGASGAPGMAGGTLGAFASSRSLVNGTVKLTIDVTGPGELDAVDGSSAGASTSTEKTGSPKIKPISKFVSQAGTVTMTLVTSKPGRRILRRKGKLRVPVRVTFTPASGSPVERSLKVKFRIRVRR
ncbi:MAG TPA: hypothetical protein VI035_05590, partial [Solirubrobacterales bacterium]